MSIDTDAKRANALCARRLPWFRRFPPYPPDGSVSDRDRFQEGFVYQADVVPGGGSTKAIGGGVLRGGVASTQ